MPDREGAGTGCMLWKPLRSAISHHVMQRSHAP